jgi:dGTPase
VQPLGRYDADLVVPAAVAAECALLKALAIHYVMGRTGAAQRQIWQRNLLTELAEMLLAQAPTCLDRALIPDWRAAGSDADRLRVIIDQVAQLTDSSASTWHDRLVGVSA